MKPFLTLLCCTILIGSRAQQMPDAWDLRACIEYAIAHNISIKQADVQSRISALQADQAHYNLYPTLNGQASTGLRFGRSIDPTTNTFATAQLFYQNFGLNAGMQLYNQGRLKYAEQVAIFNARAALADVAKVSNDISFTVATYYLQILSSKEQIEISKVQIAQSLAQFDITKKRVDAGVLPELSLAEVEAQLGTDSSNYYTAISSDQQNLLNMRGLLNLDPSITFNILTPPVDKIPMETFGELQPALVYGLAMQNQPLQKADSLRIKSAEQNVLVNKALMYPTLTIGGNLSTNFSNSFKYISGATFGGYAPVTGAEPIVTIGGTNYAVQSPVYKLTQQTRSFGQIFDGYGNQLDNNFGQNIGLTLSIPILNAHQGRTAYRQSKLQLQSVQLQKNADDVKLKQDIYAAYTNAVTALQKYNAGKKSVESAQKAYDFATKRYDIGLLNSLDLLTIQNNLLRAKLLQLTNQYDYVFKMKLLEFYKGNGIKL